MSISVMKRKPPKTKDLEPELIKKEKIIKTEPPRIISKDERENFKKSLYRPPTSEELSQLKETESLYKNSLFRMQLSYLLDEVKISDKKAKSVNEFLHSMHNFLTNLPSTEKHDVSDVSYLPKGIRFPLPSLLKSTVKGKFHFEKSPNIKVVGSHLLKTVTKPNLNVDVSVEIPKECFQVKDYLNFRYHTKRAMYLIMLASHLRKWDEVSEVYFSRLNNHPYKPILVLKPAGKAGKRFVVRIFPSIPDGLFKFSRFGPKRNNVREAWFNKQEEDAKDTEISEKPTSYYNCSILMDMLFEKHLHVLHNALSECPAIVDAICLFKVWLHQREFDQGSNGFSGFMASMLMSYLLSNRKLSSHMSSYQIFRVTLNYLATADWTIKGISMVAEDGEKHVPLMEEFHEMFDVVFIDPSGYLNLCADMRKITFNLIKYEAKLSIELLDNIHVDGFNVLFCKAVQFSCVFDHWFKINEPSVLKDCAFRKDHHWKIIDRGGDWLPTCLDWIVPILEKGLGARIKMLALKPNETRDWSLKKKPPTSSISDVVFGLILDTDHSAVILDMGPPADDPKAINFRKFWGDKSELRRFKDGSINEAVVWSGSSVAEKNMICKQVVEYLLNQHCDISTSSISYVGDQLNTLLQPKYILPNNADHHRKQNDASYGTGEEGLQTVLRTFDELGKQIRKLDELPLQVNTIQGVSSVLRLTEVMPPRPCSHHKVAIKNVAFDVPLPAEKCPCWCPVVEAVLQFEVSGKWPDDLDAIQHVKTAFHIKLARELQEQCQLICVPTPKYIDVLKNGFIFRIRIFHYREMVLFQQSHAEGALKKEHELLDTNMIKLPLHHSYIHSLHQHFAAYGQTTRLAKRWVLSHMLGDHLSEEAIELLTASLFMTALPHRPAGSHVNGFLRFLNLLANFDWQKEPLILNFNDSFTDDDYHTINEKFTAARSQLPCMFVATPYDKEKSIWTKDRPTAQILRRLKVVAIASKGMLEEQLQTSSSEDSIKQIFRPPLDNFDVLIELNREQIPRHYQAVDTSIRIKPPTGKITKSQSMPVVQFDPVQMYLTELRDAFSDTAIFFYDHFGGTFIGVVWKTQAFVPMSFKILKMQYKKLLVAASSNKIDTTSQVVMVPNTDAILEDFKILGRGLVTNVKLNRTVDHEV